MKIIFITLLTITFAFSYSIDEISKSKTWLALLHYDDGEKSSILNDDFFLSVDGKNDPLSELKETLYSFKKDKYICKYPARFLYLSSYFALDISKLNRCKSLKQWSLIKNVDDISVVFVSGFLGNPASAFGHSFMKMNKKDQPTDLFDISISYGAKLPQKNNMFLYIYNGVTGGYIASYSDKYYYMDDMVYSNQEYREMWEYKLLLDQKQKDILLYHLWELRGINFKYYFFNRNCGYKLSKLLDIVYKKDITDKALVWYAPIETFYKLKSYGYIKDITYHPSDQQKIYNFYSNLSSDEKKVVEKLIKNDENITLLEKFDEESQKKLLDFIIKFQKYSKNSVETKYLLQRMKLSASNYKLNKTPYKKPVTDANKMSYFKLGYKRYDNENYALLGFSAFNLDKVGYNMLDGDMLSIFDLEVLINSKNSIKIDKLDFIKIRRLKTQTIPFDKESPFSWEIKASYEDKKRRDWIFDGGIGYSRKFLKYFKGYFITHLILHSSYKTQLKPTLGIYANLDTFRFNLEFGSLYDKNVHLLKQNIYEFQAEYRYKTQKSIFIKSQNIYEDSFQIGLKWFF